MRYSYFQFSKERRVENATDYVTMIIILIFIQYQQRDVLMIRLCTVTAL